MANEVTMPRLSDSMEEGTILKWLVSEGDEVRRGQELVEIETDKANMTYEADSDGTLVEIVAQEGDTLPIGELIARLGRAGETEQRHEEAEGARPQPQSEDGGEPDAPARERVEEDADGGDGRVKASPVARRMARERGVELATLEGSGPGGRIVKADVEAAADGGEKPAPPAPKEDRRPPGEDKAGRPAAPEPQPAGEAGAKGEVLVQDLTRLQQTVSRRMAESKATAPDYQLNVEVDMSACLELRARLADPLPSFNDIVVKACAVALREFPRVNGAYRDGRFERYSRVNVGIAVAAQDTLAVPTIFDADQRSLSEIARKARELIGKVREGTITPPELSGGTFTVSNLGMYGINSFSAVINPPQAALLTVGAVSKKPMVEESGRIVARETMSVTLVCDHRILYGADGAQFLARVRELLEHPLSLAL
jgi:pyruvate dehydrogenase E2 component (dihydrolipoamide acetyltransferase)